MVLAAIHCSLPNLLAEDSLWLCLQKPTYTMTIRVIPPLAVIASVGLLTIYPNRNDDNWTRAESPYDIESRAFSHCYPRV
jgi:hypothetical protein